MTVILGLDIGTTTICGVAISERGERLATVQRPNDSAVTGLPPGYAEQDPARIRDRCFEVLRELRTAAGPADLVGLTGQMHGMLCVSASGEPLSNLITWQDARCLEPLPDGPNYIEAMRRAAPDELWSACGCLPASGFMGATLYWMQRNAAIPSGTARVSFVHDWLAGTLAGQLPITDPGDAGSAGVFDLQRMCWHDAIIGALSLPASLLPPVRESGQIIGRLCAEAVTQTGLALGTPIANATGDNQASVIGSVADATGSVLLNLGTGGQISWAVDAFQRQPGMETRYLPGQRYMLVGASLCGGRAYAWLNDTVREWLAHFDCRPERADVYERLNALAAAAPTDAAGLRARTTLAGTRADPSLRGAFEGIDLANFTLPNVARAVLLGMVDELAGYHESIKDAKAGRSRHTRVVASGNAVRANPLLPHLIEERFNRSVSIPQHQEEAAFGAALTAGVGAGVWPDFDTAGECIQYGGIE